MSDLRCTLCNRYLVMNEDGYFYCLSGHGGLVLDTLDVEPEPALPSLFITGEECHD
jgi:hypothetical protein